MTARPQTVGGTLRHLRSEYERLVAAKQVATTRDERLAIQRRLDRVLDDFRTIRVLRHGHSLTL